MGASQGADPEHISIHALLAESDLTQTDLANRAKLFLSTLSLRRATGRTHKAPMTTMHFYPRSPCGERRQAEKT